MVLARVTSDAVSVSHRRLNSRHDVLLTLNRYGHCVSKCVNMSAETIRLLRHGKILKHFFFLIKKKSSKERYLLANFIGSSIIRDGFVSKVESLGSIADVAYSHVV